MVGPAGLAAALVVLVLGGAPVGSRPPAAPAVRGRTPTPSAPRLEGAPLVRVGGESYVSAAELARLLDASKFWRPETRKLVLRARAHRITLAVGLPFVIVDDRTWQLERPVLIRAGTILAPASLLEVLPRDSLTARLVVDERRSRVLVTPTGGFIGTPRLEALEGRTRVTFTTERPADATVIGRDRAHFRLRLSGTFVGAAPDSLPPGSLVRRMRPIDVAAGSAFELVVSREAEGFRLIPDARTGRVAIEFLRSSADDLEPFAPEGPEGARPLRVVVLDPGHGGEDAGVVAADATEKDLALTLASLLQRELGRRTGARVVTTRDDDRALPAAERAEIANRAHADLVLSLHFDGCAAPQARGATVYCAPATRAGDAAEPPGRGGALALTPWRDVATQHAVASRALAEAIASALEQRGLGPARVHERLTMPLLGVDSPGLLIECAMLTSPADRARLLAPDGLRDLAEALADGVLAYHRP